MGCHPSRTSNTGLEDGSLQFNCDSPDDRIEGCPFPHDPPSDNVPGLTPTDHAIEDDARINNQDEEPIIHHLPIEILSEIFRLCGDPSSVTDILSLGPVLFPALTPTLDFGRHTFLASAFALQQVCRRWYHLARALPELWTQLDFGHRLPADPVRVAEMCIERAGALPLTLRLRQTDSCAQAACRALLGVVAENPGRWRQLVIEVRDGDVVLRPMLECADGSMADLQVAVIRTVLPWGQAQGSCKVGVLAKFHSNFPGLRLMHNSIPLYLYLTYEFMLRLGSSLEALETIHKHYSVSAPKNRVVSRMTIEFATPPNGDARASRGRGHSDSDSDEQGTSLASQAAPTSCDASLVMIEHSHRPSRLRALRNYLAHRLIRGSSRHAEAESQAAMNEHATNEPNAPEPTPEERSSNESTSSPSSPSALTTQLIVDASDARRHAGLERAICQMEERLARLSARLDEVERRLPDTSPLPSSVNPSPPEPPDNDRDLPKRSAVGGPIEAHSAPHARSTSPASSLVGPPSSRHSAPRALASDAQDVPLVAPPPTYASSSPSPPSHSPPGLQSHRRRTRPGAANGRNGPPVTPTTLNISGQSIVDPPSSTLEAWDGTLPDGVSNGVPSRSLLAPGGAASMAIGSYPLGGVQDDTDMPLSQPHANLDWSMPPPPPQLPIPLPDVEEHDDGAAPPPLRGPVSLPDIEEPEIKLTPLHLPDPLPTGDDFDSGDLDNALNLNMTHPELPILLPRLEYRHQSPTPSMVPDDPEADDLARERAKVRLLQLLQEPGHPSSLSDHDVHRTPADAIPRGRSGIYSLDHPPFSPEVSAAGHVPGATTLGAIPRLAEQARPTDDSAAHDATIKNNDAVVAPSVVTPPVEVGADSGVPNVNRAAEAPTVPKPRSTVSRTSSPSGHLPTFVGASSISRPCPGSILLIDVGDGNGREGFQRFFSGDFDLAIERLMQFSQSPTSTGKHSVTQLHLRIRRSTDRRGHDVMTVVMSALSGILGHLHVVEIFMDEENPHPSTSDAFRGLTHLRRLHIEGEAQGKRFLCFPLHLVRELVVKARVSLGDISMLLQISSRLDLLVVDFRCCAHTSTMPALNSVKRSSHLPGIVHATSNESEALLPFLQKFSRAEDWSLLRMSTA
ncbi:uncharacterized protein SCHCODRAFT_01193686 [Schizophyllum commune H4-8]|uniref:Uncharacterized protein n=1 Tax=Schizophyllum commune (strain H4-8 / FGSC 9210) TaxID=578458 RepID=D8PM28_SCHCM|nr:uncharacterized protein SCHCODRAFT_01193686 [Schizophyllum commune H4-8]KAI5898948.1 hypothetical protein SCHCODRAFT_01193686 [Schizophyllum commune H4-8]